MISPPTQTAKEAAADLGVSLSTIYRWLKTGEIRKHGVTGRKVNGRWVISLIEDAPAADIEQQIRAAYTKLAGGPGVWVGLAQLTRARLPRRGG
jgi:excisionase family DNA binding protein